MSSSWRYQQHASGRDLSELQQNICRHFEMFHAHMSYWENPEVARRIAEHQREDYEEDQG
jgi:predicted small metal-binding protein